MKNLKKILPFLVPLVAIAVLVFLVWRWYTAQTQQVAVMPETSPKIQIESLSEAEINELDKFSLEGNYQTEKMKKVADNFVGQAEVRFKLEGEKVLMAVFADLEDLTAGENYQLWLGNDKSEDWQAANLLTSTKGGFTTSLTLSREFLPLNLKITRENPIKTTSNDLFVATVSAVNEQ